MCYQSEGSLMPALHWRLLCMNPFAEPVVLLQGVAASKGQSKTRKKASGKTKSVAPARRRRAG
jgi:hypothetical protein